MNKPITNSEDYLDSRDIQERITELQDKSTLKVTTASEAIEMHYLVSLKTQYIELFSLECWGYGAQFIRQTYMKDYAIELAESMGAIKEGLQWPNNCIDWEQATKELEMDYMEVTFDDVIYNTREA